MTAYARMTKLPQVSTTLRSPAAGAAPALLIERTLAHVRDAWGRSGPYRAISVDELAGAAAVSSAHLSRVFRSRHGTAPGAALERLRIARAAFLLRHGSEPLASIASWCGFADQYHFSHRFSAICAVPPGAYRRNRVIVDFRDPLNDPGLAELASMILPSALVEQLDDTAAPPPLLPGQRFAQTFTVPSAMAVNQVCLYLATWFSSDSAATVRLTKINDADPRPVTTRRLSAMVDHAAEWISFPAQGSGRYRLELSEAVGTPTWKWHQGTDVAAVGGSAEIDGVQIANTNFLFSATISG